MSVLELSMTSLSENEQSVFYSWTLYVDDEGFLICKWNNTPRARNTIPWDQMLQAQAKKKLENDKLCGFNMMVVAFIAYFFLLLCLFSHYVRLSRAVSFELLKTLIEIGFATNEVIRVTHSINFVHLFVSVQMARLNLKGCCAATFLSIYYC